MDEFRNYSRYSLWNPGGDTIYGNGGDDIIYGDDNNEHNLALLAQLKSWVRPERNWGISASSGGLVLGNDLLDGGPGDDQITGGFGSDAIIGGKGSDIIKVGDQIVAEGYEPLWGPKVVWGDEYNSTNKRLAQSEHEPDVFLIGDIFANAADIEASSAGVTEIVAKRNEANNAMQDFKSNWNRYIGPGIGLVPGLGGVIRTLGDLLFSVISEDGEVTPRLGPSAKAVDALTVIKDFDENDQLVIRAAPGEGVEVQLPTNHSYNTVNSNKIINPLAYNFDGLGRMITLDEGPSVQFNRVLLEGYTDVLYKLGQKVDDQGNLLLHFGGKAYSEFGIGDPA